MASLSQIPQGMAGSPQAGAPDGNGSAEDASKRAAEEQMRRDLLTTVLDTEARERLSRIALVSPERSRQVEAILLRMAQSGQLKGRVTESQLIDLLEQADEAHSSTTTAKKPILYQRRRDLDDDWDI